MVEFVTFLEENDSKRNRYGKTQINRKLIISELIEESKMVQTKYSNYPA
jgi:hypothetical protein